MAINQTIQIMGQKLNFISHYALMIANKTESLQSALYNRIKMSISLGRV